MAPAGPVSGASIALWHGARDILGFAPTFCQTKAQIDRPENSKGRAVDFLEPSPVRGDDKPSPLYLRR